MSIYQQLQAIKANDEQVMLDFYLDNFIQFKKYLLQNKCSLINVKVIYQEACLAVWRHVKMDKFSSQEEGALELYLLHVARSKWLEYFRIYAFTKDSLPDLDRSALEVFNELDDDTLGRLAMMKAYFSATNLACKKLLSLCFYNKRPLIEVAADMSWTEEVTKNNKYRCVEKLLKSMS